MTVVIGKVFWRRPVRVSLQHQEMDHYEVRDFMVYMFAHAHVAIISLLTAVAVYRGAERYTYYATEMYGRSVRKEFKDILPEEPARKTKGKKQS